MHWIAGNRLLLMDETRKQPPMIGFPLIELDRVDSTNRYAESLLEKGMVAEGTVIRADEQFAGKGQHDNIWISEPGRNLTFTVILHPHRIPPGRQFLLNKAMALGVCDFIRGMVGKCTIKWPNDILVSNRKIAGILISHKIMGASIADSVIGIGININQQRFPSDLSNPVSLVQLQHRETDLRDAFKNVCQRLETRYAALCLGKHQSIDTSYRDALLGIGEWRMFLRNGEKFSGKITGVDDLGRLLVETRDQRTTAFNHKEIEYIIP
jgi:BirA family biotin operon repressor/biotin-[acetyl-CoA-carboxylase] ligase